MLQYSQILKQFILMYVLITIVKCQNGKQPPVFPITNTTLLAMVGKPFELNCDVYDNDIFFNGYYLGALSIIRPVISNNRFNVSSTVQTFTVPIRNSQYLRVIYRKTLTFNNVSKFDAGTYYCGLARIAIRMVVLKDDVVFQPSGISNNLLYIHLKMEFYSGYPLIVFGNFYNTGVNRTFGGNVLPSDRQIHLGYSFSLPYNGIYSLTFRDITTSSPTPQPLLFTI
jgi:hypothetical protein